MQPDRSRPAAARGPGGNPAISVAMSVYNNAPYLREAIASIRQQSLADFEFLIVNDGSTDGSADILDAQAAEDPRLRVIHQENRGLIASLNRLVDEACAPWIARMDGDDISVPDRFARQLDFLARNPGHVVLGGNNVLIGPDGGKLEHGGAKPITHQDMLANLEHGPLISHPAAIIHRDTLRGVGGYHPAFRHCEDYDLWLRLVALGKIANLPDILVEYRVYPEQVSSRHITEQACNAAIAWLAHKERAAGRPDPTEQLDRLPPVVALDGMFGPGSADYVRRRILDRILYVPEALAGDGYGILLDHIARQGGDPGYWRAAARVLKAGRPRSAAGIAAALLRAG